MADSDINALLQNVDSVPTVKTGGLVQVNPLAAITAGNQAAQSEFQTREWQAKQAAGQAYQGAIDPNTGEFDPNKFRRLLSQSGPAALQAGTALANTQSISSDELNQQKLKLEAHNASLGSLMAMGDGVTHADVVGKIQYLMAHNMLTLPEAQRIMSTVPANQADLPAWVKQHALTVADATTRFNQTLGTRQTFSTPTGDYNAPVPPPGADQPTIFTPKGPDPGAVQPGGKWVDAEGKPTQQGAPGAVWQPGDTPKVGNSAFPQPGPPQIIQPGGGGAGGRQFPPKPPFITPDEAAPPASGPGSIGNTPGRGNYVRPKFDPQTGERLSDGPGLSAPSPGRAGGAPDSPSTHQALPAKPAPAQPGNFIPTGPPQGQEAKLAADITASSAARLAMGDQQKRLIAGQSALDALKLADTGPSTGFFAKAYAFLKAQGFTTVERGQLSDTDYRQLLQKNLLRFAQNNGQAAGTDLGLETKLHSNANADEMLAAANRQVLIQDMGILKRDIAQTQEMPEPSGTGDVVKHVGSFPANTAPEAFMWNDYTNEERDAIEKEYKDKGQTQKLHDSLALAVKRGAIPDPRPKAAPPQRGSFLVPPPGPRVNALSMVG